MRSAFTVIELMVVLLVVSIVTGAVTLSLGSARWRAEMDDVVGEVAQFDLLARQCALRHGQSRQLVFDLDADRLARVSLDAQEEAAIVAYALPRGFRLAELVLADGGIATGQATVRCSNRGYTPSYALCLEGPTGRQWVLFAGLTGQMIQADEERIREIVALLSGQGPHAD